jgi:hypothetical protein
VVRKIYAGPREVDGKQIFPGLMPSSEAGKGQWEDWVTGSAPGSSPLMYAFSTNFFQYMVFSDAKWNYHTANINQALQSANRQVAADLNATDPNLEPFRARGGKLILYHGWLDSAISPINSINYYSAVTARMSSAKVEHFIRFYLVPGMGHCAGGPGPYIFGQLGMDVSRDPKQNVFTSLEQWVEKGTAPSSIVTSSWRDPKDRSKGIKLTRPLCPYPAVAVYDGHGNSNDAASFTCTTGG